MNSTHRNRISHVPPRRTRLPDRRRMQDLATRIGRARLVYLLGRSGTPLTDWVPLGLAAAVIGLMFVAGPGIAMT
jgi:hypothetical protein